MKLTLEVYSTSAGDAGGAPSFGVRIRDRRALEAGALYDPLDVNFLVDREFLPAPETMAVSIYRPSEDGGSALVATTAGSAFAPVPGHSMMHRGVLATATQGFDSWYEETRCPDGDHTYPVPVFSILEVRWSCGAEDCMARAGAVPAILTPIGVRAVKGLDGTDGEDGKAPEVDVADRGDGTHTMTVTSPDGTVQTVEWRDGRDGDGTAFPAPVSPADATEDDQYADALAVKGLLDSLRKDLSGVEARLDVFDSLTGIEYLESIRESLAAKVDRREGYDLVSTGYISVLGDFIGKYGKFGGLACLDKITFTELGTDLAGRFKALEAAVESLPPSGDGGTLNAGYVKFLDTVVASGDDSAQRILDAVDLVLAESNDAGKGIWKAVNANAKGLAELEAKVGSGGSSPIPAELEAMIRNSVQKDAFGRGFSSNDFTQDYIDRINNSVQKEAGKGLSTVDFTMERAERLDALFNSSPTLNPPVKPDGNAKKGQPADAKDTYEALKGLSFTKAPDSHGSDWGDFSITSTNSSGSWSFVTTPPIEWREPPVSNIRGWHLCPFEFKLENEVPAPGIIGSSLAPGRYKLDSHLWVSDDKNLTSGSASFTSWISTTGTNSPAVGVNFIVRFSRELYLYKGDSYVTKTYVDDRIADEIGKIEFPEPVVPDVTLPNDISCASLHAANSVTVGSRSSAEDTPGQSSFSSGRGNIASGDHSHAEGDSVIAKGLNSHAEGCTTEAKGNCSHAEGKFTVASGAYSHAAGFRAKAQQYAYAWSGVESDEVYESNGDGTYNINPANGIEGFYVGDKNLKTILSEEAPVPDLSGYVKKTGSGGVYLGLQYSEDMENPPLFLEIEGALKMGQPSPAGDEALLEMQAGGRPGGFKVRVTPSYDETAGEEVSSTTMSIDDIPDVAGELRKISAKRDKANNIAAADEVCSISRNWVCSPSKVVFDNKEWELSVKWISENPEDSDSIGWAICFDGEPRYGYTVFKDREATTLTWRESDDWTGYETITATASGELLVEFYTKSGEPYVTPAGVKALAVPGFNQLAPETSDTTVTLKPADGKANWAPSFNVSSSPLKLFSINLSDISLYYTCHDSGGHFTLRLSCDNLTEKNAVIRGIEVPLGASEGLLYFESTESISLGYNNAPSGLDMSSFPASLEPGPVPYCNVVFDFKGDESDNIEECNFSLIGYELYGIDFPSQVELNGQTYFLDGAMGPFGITQSLDEGAKISVTLPDSTDHVCSFSLALTTDAKEEEGVTWEGADKVIEAFPGAKKLAPGTTVWDVKEVMPGIFLVDRAPATSGTPTIVGDNGTTYTLGVDTDGTLEVRQ